MAKINPQANIFERLAELGGIQAREIRGDVIEQFTGKPPTNPNLPNSEHASQRNFTPLDTHKMEENFKQQHDDPELASQRAALKAQQVKPEDQQAFSRFRREEKTFYSQQEREKAQAKKEEADTEAARKQKLAEDEKQAQQQDMPQGKPKGRMGKTRQKANVENKLGKAG